MEEHCVIPDVIDTHPPEALRIEWGPDVKAEMGTVLTPTQVFHPPSVIQWTAKEDALYTLVFTDPDSPSQLAPSRVEVLHWLVFNIPGCNLSKGLEHADYIGSLPVEGTGFHRYVYLIYEQDEIITPNGPFRPRNRATNPLPIGRKPFDTRALGAEYRLGEPVAGNFYVAEYDENVPEMKVKVLTE